MNSTAHKRTAFQKWPLIFAAVCGGLSVALWFVYIWGLGGWSAIRFSLPVLGQFSVGITPPLLVLQALGGTLMGMRAEVDVYLGASILLGAVATGLVIAGLRPMAEPLAPPSEAGGAPLFPPLKRYRDFYWSTLAAYGGGILLAELLLVFGQMLLAGGVSLSGATVEDGGPFSLSPVTAFAASGLIAGVIAFVAGFLGALRGRRLSVPEATIGLLYFGLPIPIFLSVVSAVPQLTVEYGYSLREVIYVASLLGRPEASFWLAYIGLVMFVVFGITVGFVATGSGRVDLNLRTEMFIARRHVSIFRPKLLLGGLVVLVFGIIPPLLIYAMILAAEAAVERTRIRILGERDPLDATRALHEWKLREQTPTAMMTALSVGGVGLGVMALIIVLSVMSGFEEDLQDKILGTNAHVVVTKYSDFVDDELTQTAQKVRGVAGVKGATRFILNQAMIASEANMDGTLVKGIDPDTVSEVTDLKKYLKTGADLDGEKALDYLRHPEKLTAPRLSPTGGAAVDGDPALGEPTFKKQPLNDELMRDPIIGEIGKQKTTEVAKMPVLPGIIVGNELASNLKVIVGDRVNVVTPISEELGPSGPMPKSRAFRVAGIFHSGMYEYDSKMAYLEFKEAQSFFKGAGIIGVEMKVHEIDDARRIAKTVLGALDGYPYKTRDWGEMNKNLFSALRLEKLVMGIILSIIVIVAAGLIVATVIMLVLEKRKEIAVLKALGVSDGGVLKIFLAEGLQIGIAGSVLGLISGLVWCWFIAEVGFDLDPEVYYIPSLPVRIIPLQVAIPVVIAVVVSFIASVYPALKAARVEPVEGLKAE